MGAHVSDDCVIPPEHIALSRGGNWGSVPLARQYTQEGEGVYDAICRGGEVDYSSRRHFRHVAETPELLRSLPA